jgi:hypothetical protein
LLDLGRHQALDCRPGDVQLLRLGASVALHRLGALGELLRPRELRLDRVLGLLARGADVGPERLLVLGDRLLVRALHRPVEPRQALVHLVEDVRVLLDHLDDDQVRVLVAVLLVGAELHLLRPVGPGLRRRPAERRVEVLQLVHDDRPVLLGHVVDRELGPVLRERVRGVSCMCSMNAICAAGSTARSARSSRFMKSKCSSWCFAWFCQKASCGSWFDFVGVRRVVRLEHRVLALDLDQIGILVRLERREPHAPASRYFASCVAVDRAVGVETSCGSA